MAGLDVAWIPFSVLYLLYLIPPSVLEVWCYYSRGGLVRYEDLKYDDSFMNNFIYQNDKNIYFKRFCDRPKSDAGKAFFSWLDWSGETYDRCIYIHRRNLARGDHEVSPWWPQLYGPFVFNFPKKVWLRGDDACGMRTPAWGVGGEERAKKEFAAAAAKGFDKHYHYQIMRQIRREQALAAATAPETK